MIYITHEKSTGRAGHQYKDAIAPLIIAEMFDYKYVYTPYKSLEFFNLGEGDLLRSDLPSDIPVVRLVGPYWYGIAYDALISQLSDLEKRNGASDCLVVLANSFRVQLFQLCEWYFSGQIKTNLYQHVIEILRRKFRARNPAPRTAQTAAIDIAVHIRRGDVANPRKLRVPSSQHYAHGMEYYDAILRKLKRSLRDRQLEIHIYTESINADDVVSYCKESPEIFLHQGGKAEFAEHFTAMAYSDILVVSNSSMSQMAGHLSNGLKIYHPNDQYHSLPPEEFLPITDFNKEEIPTPLLNIGRAG